MNRRAFVKAGMAGAGVLLTRAGSPGKPVSPLTPDTLLKDLRPAHPRLLASTEDFASLKGRVGESSKLAAWKDSLKKEADGLLAATPSIYEIPDGLRLLATSRRVLNRIYTLAMMYRLDGEQHYADRAWQELAAAAAFPDWNPRHFLDTAEMTHAFAIGYDWLYDVWTPQQRKDLQTAMVEKGLKPALALYRGQKTWTRMRHNWNQVCNGGIGMGSLALASVEQELCGEILKSALESLPLAMAEFSPDGAWKEGPGYWNYATFYNVVFIAALETALGSDFGLSSMEGFSQTGLFPLYLTGPLGRTFNYADGSDHAIHPAQSFWLGRKFDQPVIGWAERKLTTPSPLDLLWYDSRDAGPKSAGLPLDKYFRQSEVAVFRSEWENAKALFVGFKAGDNKANHSHLDLGSFIFDALGARWAIDLGSDNYNLPAYFGNQRWTYYRLRTEGQNALVINPGAEPDQDPGAATRMIRFGSKPERAFAVADLTAAYHKHASRVWRGIALLDRNKLLIQDEITANKPAEIWWFMHTPAVVKLHDDGRSATLQQLGLQLRAEILSPTAATFELMDAQPLPTSPHPQGQAKNEGVRKLTIHLKETIATQISVLLTPVSGEQTKSPAAPHFSALSEW